MQRLLVGVGRFGTGVALKRSGGSELAELVSDHVFRNVYRHVFSAVMNGNGMTHKLRENRGSSRPGF